MIATAKITSKGQITIPKKIRMLFSTPIVEFSTTADNKVVMSSVTSVGGSLNGYAPKYVPLSKVRESIQKALANEKK